MNYLSIPHYRGLKEKYSESLHGDGLYFTTDTHEIIANNASHGDNIASWDLHDGILTLTMKSGAQQIVNFTEASETEKGLLSAADKKQLNNLQDNLDSKVDKVTGKSLILDSEIQKLAGLPNSTELTNSIANAKAAGDNAQSDLDAHKLNVSNPHQVTKAQLGLENVTNDAQVKRSEMGVAGGVATLDGTGKVPAAQLPAYVDDVLEGTLINATTFQLAEGQQGGVQLPNVIYVDTTTNKSYRWSGTQYVTIASDLALGETSSTAYPGDKGKAATDNINKVKSTALSHIDDTTPVTYSASKVTVNYECYEGDQYGGAGTKHGADIAAASETAAGVMTAADKNKLNAIEVGAQVNTVTGVKGNSESSYRTGDVNITKDNIGLSNVDNTSDLDKPISNAVQDALDEKISRLYLGYRRYPIDNSDSYNTIQFNLEYLESSRMLCINDPNHESFTNCTLPLATTDADGLFSHYDKSKLDGIESGAQVNTITGIKGDNESVYRTGEVNITKDNIGLGNVDNTSDLEKPISDAVQDALKLKKDTIYINNYLQHGYSSNDVNLAIYLAFEDGNIYIAQDKDNYKGRSYDVVSIPYASATTNGWMTMYDKVKLDGIESEAQVNVIESVKVNGVAKAISNKEVDIPVPTNLSQLTNDIYEIATSAEITAILN